MSKFKFEDLQPWTDMLIDALQNKGSSSSGMPDLLVYPYAEKYRNVLQQIRDKKISSDNLNQFLNTNYNEIMDITIQPYRLKCLLEAIKIYFYKEFMK